MRLHLIDNHRHDGRYLSDTEVNRHLLANNNAYYPNNREQNYRYQNQRENTMNSSGPTNELHRGLNMNAGEFTNMITSVTNLISQNVNQNVGHVFGVAAQLANFSGQTNPTRCQYPMNMDIYPQQEKPMVTSHRKAVALDMPKEVKIPSHRAICDAKDPIVISDSDSDESPEKGFHILKSKITYSF